MKCARATKPFLNLISKQKITTVHAHYFAKQAAKKLHVFLTLCSSREREREIERERERSQFKIQNAGQFCPQRAASILINMYHSTQYQ